MEKREGRSLINSGPLVCFFGFVLVAGFSVVVSMRRDSPVHRVANGRTSATLDTTSQSTMEMSLAMDVVHLIGITVYDEVASSEGAVLDSLVSDMKRDRDAVERAGCEIARAVESREGDRLALVGSCVHNVSLDGLRCACQVARKG